MPVDVASGMTAEAPAARAAAKTMSTPSPSHATTKTKPMLGAVVSRSSSARKLQPHTDAPMSNGLSNKEFPGIGSDQLSERPDKVCC